MVDGYVEKPARSFPRTRRAGAQMLNGIRPSISRSRDGTLRRRCSPWKAGAT